MRKFPQQGSQARQTALHALLDKLSKTDEWSSVDTEYMGDWDKRQHVSDFFDPDFTHGDSKWAKWLQCSDAERNATSALSPRHDIGFPLIANELREARTLRHDAVLLEPSERPYNQLAELVSTHVELGLHDCVTISGSAKSTQRRLPLMSAADDERSACHISEPSKQLFENANAVCVVYDDNDEDILGTAAVSENDLSVFNDADEAQDLLSTHMKRTKQHGFIVVKCIAVRSSHRGAGIGEALMHAIQEEYPQHMLIVHALPNANTVDFFEHMGFACASSIAETKSSKTRLSKMVRMLRVVQRNYAYGLWSHTCAYGHAGVTGPFVFVSDMDDYELPMKECSLVSMAYDVEDDENGAAVSAFLKRAFSDSTRVHALLTKSQDEALQIRDLFECNPPSSVAPKEAKNIVRALLLYESLYHTQYDTKEDGKEIAKLARKYDIEIDADATDVITIVREKTLVAFVSCVKEKSRVKEESSRVTFIGDASLVLDSYAAVVRLLLAVRFAKYECDTSDFDLEWDDVSLMELVRDVWTPQFACYYREL